MIGLTVSGQTPSSATSLNLRGGERGRERAGSAEEAQLANVCERGRVARRQRGVSRAEVRRRGGEGGERQSGGECSAHSCGADPTALDSRGVFTYLSSHEDRSPFVHRLVLS